MGRVLREPESMARLPLKGRFQRDRITYKTALISLMNKPSILDKFRLDTYNCVITENYIYHDSSLIR